MSKGVSVQLAHPSGLVVLEKPPGIRTHPRGEQSHSREDDACLLSAPYDFEQQCFFWQEKGETRRLYMVNRLDSPTSGVLIGTENEELAALVRDIFIRNRVVKTYQAIVFGRPPNPQDMWEDFLKRRRKRSSLRVVPSPGGALARTRMLYIRQDVNNQNLSLIKLLPATGRTHQLRVQCAVRGLPIVNDRTYGDFQASRELRKLTGESRMFLHSSAVQMKFRWCGEDVAIDVESPLPEAFDRVMGFNRKVQMETNYRDAPRDADLSRLRRKLHKAKNEWARPAPPQVIKSNFEG